MKDFNKTLLQRARHMRGRPTTAEDILWYKVLRKKKIGYRFVRQKTCLKYILDFYCPFLHLAIEVDGIHHRQAILQDGIRSRELERKGIKVIRVWNDQVINHLSETHNWLKVQLEDRLLEKSKSGFKSI